MFVIIIANGKSSEQRQKAIYLDTDLFSIQNSKVMKFVNKVFHKCMIYEKLNFYCNSSQ